MQTDSSTIPLYVAIDMGKNVHTYAAYAGLQLAVVQAPQEVLSIRSGYEPFRDWLRGLLDSARYGPVILGYEPTGIYHESWEDALLADFGAVVQIRRINTIAVRRKREQLHGGRKQKNDAWDAEAIAHCLRDELGYPAQARAVATLRFSLWSTAIRQKQQALYRLNRQVLVQVERLWPGMLLKPKAFKKAHPQLAMPEPLVRTQPLNRQALQLLLAFQPNPYDWLPGGAATIRAFYRAHKLRCGKLLSGKVQDVLTRTLFPAPEIAQLLATQLQQTYRHYQRLERELQLLLDQAEELVPNSPAAVLTTIPGIAPYLAAQYVAFVGDVSRFSRADQIWSLAGFDLLQDDSGDRRRVGKLTKRGDGAFRQVLFIIGLTTANACPQLDAVRKRARRHGKRKVGAVLHVAHKVNRVCFRLLRDQVPFDPQQLK